MVLPRRRLLTGAALAGLAFVLPGCRPSSTPGERKTAEGEAPRGVRIDLRHAARAGAESFEITRVAAEPLWSPPAPHREAPDWGDYRLSLYDPATGTLLWRGGFDSNLDPAAASAVAAISVRCVRPATPCTAVIEKRRAGAVFQALLDTTLDPSNAGASAPALLSRIESLASNGDASTRFDLAILGDGYLESEHPKFIADARRAAGYLFSVEPFASRTGDFNVRAVFTPSASSGVTDPYLEHRRDTAFRCAYGTGAAERTLHAANERALRDAAGAVPYDALLVLANSRRYGGSAYYAGPAVVAIDSARSRYLVVHELAHAIAGLADEYYLPSGHGPAYRGNVEPWHPNVTTSERHAKWRMSKPAPTPWNKTEYDARFEKYVKRYLALRAARADEGLVEKLMQLEARRQRGLLANSGQTREPGLYEGANGYSTGMYRAEADCIMFSLQTDYYCGACTGAIHRAIDAQCA
ncbi:MAG: hypothetical protein JWO70_172 [Betaproteobacteria bacterium]|nr:hypothetical protein [Betaproteobacteria bacterium]